MQKNYADDLADHDVIEDDSELVLGPHPAKLVSCGVSTVDNRTRQLGSSSFKDTSILGSAPVAAKVAQAIPVPTPPLVASRISKESSYIYANGNPIIAAAGSRPASGVVRQPRTSAPSGLTSPSYESTPTSKSYHGGGAASGGDDGAEPRMHGDILGGDVDKQRPTQPARPKSGGLLARFGSGRNLISSSRPPSAKQDATDATASKGPDGPAAIPSPAAPCTVVSGRSTAIPCVNVDSQRRQLLGKLNVLDEPPAAAPATSVPKVAPAGSQRQSHAGEQLCEAPADSELPPAEPAARGAERRSSAGEGAVASGGGDGGNSTSAAPERPPTPLRRLSRMLSGSIVKPAAVGPTSDQRDQDGAGANKGRSGAGVAVRELFSRPSSARRKSEAGSVGAVAPQPLRAEAWNHQRPALADTDDGPRGDRVQEFGAETEPGRRPSSGILKRAASALAAALAR